MRSGRYKLPDLLHRKAETRVDAEPPFRRAVGRVAFGAHQRVVEAGDQIADRFQDIWAALSDTILPVGAEDFRRSPVRPLP